MMKKKIIRIVPGYQFDKDARLWLRKMPKLKGELEAVTDVIVSEGRIPAEYRPHFLNNPYLNYAGYEEFHLFDDNSISILVIYVKTKEGTVFHFVRLGTHEELFHGKLK